MKKFMKALATILTVATFASIPAMAEAPANENAVEETQASKAVESLFGTDIDEAGTALGLNKTQEQNEEAYLTLYEDADIMLGGRDGAVADITLFTDKYEVFGVKIGMTAEEAKATLTALGIEFTEDTIAELGIPTIEFKIPGHDGAKGTFDIADNKITDIHLYTENTAEAETAETENKEETVTTTSNKATAVQKATGYIKLTGDAHLRKNADKESASLKTMAKGTKLKYTATAKDSRGVTWYKVKSNGKTGWVSSKNTTKIKRSEYHNNSKPVIKHNSGYIELTRKGNLRKSPNKESKKIDTFASGTVLEYTATAKDSRGVTWYKVTADGHTGWISAKNVTKC